MCEIRSEATVDKESVKVLYESMLYKPTTSFPVKKKSKRF